VATDEFEMWFDKGVTDRLPVVPPIRERVEGMLDGTRRRREDLLGEMPPTYGRATVEKVAINAVMAGWRPDFMPVLVAARRVRVRSPLQPARRGDVHRARSSSPDDQHRRRPAGATSMSTFGHPGRYTYCIAENEEASPWPPYAMTRGVPEGASAVTLFAGEAPHGISDHDSRTARALAGSLGWSMASLWKQQARPPPAGRGTRARGHAGR
jgi:hypothetical protein